VAALNGWDVVTIFGALVFFAWGEAVLHDLARANLTFDSVVNNAIEYFPDALITVSRGPLWFYFYDSVHVSILMRQGDRDPDEEVIEGHYQWNNTTGAWDKV